MLKCYCKLILSFQASVDGDVTMATVLGLNAFTTYSCTVRAVTVLAGPESSPASVKTLEAGIKMIMI